MKIKSFIIALLFAAPASAAPWSTTNKIAIEGYDPVAYHTQHRAVRGSQKHSAKHDGATFYFSSADNKRTFVASPRKYLPKFGGHCAFAVAMNKAKVKADPTTFKIHNGALLLFFNAHYQGEPFNTIVPWNQNEKALMAKAEKNWRTLRN